MKTNKYIYYREPHKKIISGVFLMETNKYVYYREFIKKLWRYEYEYF